MLFVCAVCTSIDNTACAPDYWRQRMRGARQNGGRAPGALCTGCSEGEWHEQFPRRQYDPATDGPIGADQTIHPEHLEAA